MLDARPYVFVSPEYATQLPASTSESVVKYRSPRPGVDLRASSEQKGNTERGQDTAVPTASARASAAGVDAASAAGRHAGEGGNASGSQAVVDNAAPLFQHERGAAPAEGAAAGAPEHLRRPHAPLRCRPDDAAVLQLLLPSALVPVDLSLHESLCKKAAGESRTAPVLAAMGASAAGAKGAKPSSLGCFSHPLACAGSAKPAPVAPSAAPARAGASPAVTVSGTANRKHAGVSVLLRGGMLIPPRRASSQLQGELAGGQSPV